MYKANVVGMNEGVATIEIVVGEDVLRDRVNAAFRKAAQRVQVPGFRKGKAPRVLLERYVAREAVYDDVIRSVVPDAYMDALKQTNLTPLEDPEFEGLDSPDLENGQPLTFKAKVTVKPEVKLADYEAIKLERKPVEIKDEDVDRAIESMRQKRAEFIPTDRDTVEKDDLVTMDYQVRIDGEAFEGGSGKDVQVLVGAGDLVPGFEDQLVGLKKDVESEISVKFPDDYHEEKLAGRDAVFTVTVRDIKVKQLPSLDDAFAKDVAGFETLDQLKAKIRHSMQHKAAGAALVELGARALEAVVEGSEVVPPALLVNHEIDRALERLKGSLTEQGLTWEKYLEATGKSVDDVRSALSERAQKEAAVKLVVEAIAERENLLPTRDQVTMAAAHMLAYAGKADEKKLQKVVSQPSVRQSTAEYLMHENVIVFLGRKCDADPEPAVCEECERQEKEHGGHDHDHAGHDQDRPDEKKDSGASEEKAEPGQTGETAE
ncbi:MAG: trigger factor [Firmicutes bacterium]|jgi:trigger factor|nr:trigger factor [Bacillota bacterium]